MSPETGGIGDVMSLRAGSNRNKWRERGLVIGLLAVCVAVLLPPTPPSEALPSGFRDSAVFSGLQLPTAVAFAPDGKVFVAEKSGKVKLYSGLDDTSPTLFGDLGPQVHDFLDRGLLGLAVDPGFPTRPYVYALYSRDAPLGGTAPTYNDRCPKAADGTQQCLGSGRLSRLTATGEKMTSEKPLITDWCTNFASHSVGTLLFDGDGALWVGGGDGATPNTDYGQLGDNPCGDPPSPAGTALSPPKAEGGSLRSQDLRTSGDPLTLDGAILRVDPDTGEGWPGNPLAGSADANARRIVATGLRNPFRFSLRPGTKEAWVGDVGRFKIEELNRVPAPKSGVVPNFGWPCYEGAGRLAAFDNLNLNVCESLYAEGSGAVQSPYFSYQHGTKVAPDESCNLTSGDSITGGTFYEGGSYPASYTGDYFFADYAHECLWHMPDGAGGLPDASRVSMFSDTVGGIVDLKTGPGGDLFYVDIGTGQNDGSVHRISYASGNQAPLAALDAAPTSGAVPLDVTFDASRSRDPEGGALTYAWDLDGDGTFTDASGPQVQRTYETAGTYSPRVRVTDPLGASDLAGTTINAGSSPPTATMVTPTATTTWAVGSTIKFSGDAKSSSGAQLPASALDWTITLNHCIPGGDCHRHPLQSFYGTRSGSFVTPDHDYPSDIEVRLTATDNGLTDTKTVVLKPRTVKLTFATAPTNLKLVAGNNSARTAFSRRFIKKASVTVSAPSPQTLNNAKYRYRYWSDGGPQTHTFPAPLSDATYKATYRKVSTVSLLAAHPRALGVGDQAVVGRLNRRGYDVRLLPPTAPARATRGSDAIVISSTVSPEAVGRTFRHVPVPVVTWESDLYDELDMTRPGETGKLAAGRRLRIVNSRHPLAAGLAGAARVTKGVHRYNWGEPARGAIRVAQLATRAPRTAVFAYRTGQRMVRLQAPAKRVALFPDRTMAGSFTRAGWRLFDAALHWALR